RRPSAGSLPLAHEIRPQERESRARARTPGDAASLLHPAPRLEATVVKAGARAALAFTAVALPLEIGRSRLLEVRRAGARGQHEQQQHEGSRRFRVDVHRSDEGPEVTPSLHAFPTPRAGLEPATIRLTAGRIGRMGRRGFSHLACLLGFSFAAGTGKTG